VRTVFALVALAALAVAALWSLRPARAQTPRLLAISGMRIVRDKPIARVRITNVSPDAADVFFLHYTIRDTSAGIALSEPGAGDGAQLIPGRAIELDLGKIVTNFRASREVGPYTGTVQFVAFAEGGFTHEFGPEIIHVEAVQTEGAAIYDGVVAWLTQ
jgi:hypothetical protein